MLDSPSANLEVPFASFPYTGGIRIRVRSDRAVTFPAKGHNHLPQGFVDSGWEKQGKAGEQSGTDAAPPESKSCGPRNEPGRALAAP